MNWLYRLDDEGEPVECKDTKEWAEWFQQSAEARHVMKTILQESDVCVSTVFLGIDRSAPTTGLWLEDGEATPLPVLWETLIFGGPLHGQTVRYESKRESLLGHEMMVARAVRAQRRAVKS